LETETLNLFTHGLLVWAQHREFRAATAELNRYTDRELSDTGLTRSDLTRVAYDEAERRIVPPPPSPDRRAAEEGFLGEPVCRARQRIHCHRARSTSCIGSTTSTSRGWISPSWLGNTPPAPSPSPGPEAAVGLDQRQKSSRLDQTGRGSPP
jgi:uncharacterized protein YjiS (DUF1127 family)